MDCAFGELDGWVLVVHTEKPPSTTEWSALLSFYQKNLGGIRGILVFTAGGAISAFQRKQLRDVFGLDGRHLPRTAILTESALARLGIAAFNLFISNKIRGFSYQEIIAAMEYLSVPVSSRQPLLGKLEELTSMIGTRTPNYYRNL
jgi:hypothetical protein